MTNSPGLFSDIGKLARDVQYKDYSYNTKFSIITQAANGLALTSTVEHKESHSLGDVTAQYKYKNAVFDVKVDAMSNIATTLTLTDVLPSVKSIASLKLPDLNFAKVEVQSFHEHATIGSSLTLKKSPIFDFSATCGTSTTVVGIEAGYDTSIGDFTKYNACVSRRKPDACTTITLANKGDLLTASHAQCFNQMKTTTAVEFANRFSEEGNTLTVGGSYAYDDFTLIKLKLNNQGSFGAVFQHEIRPKTKLTMAAEFDYNFIDTRPKCGVLCLDECTANIDTHTASTLQNVISDECIGTTVITIAHRISTVLSMDIILVLEKGRLIEEGNPEILLQYELSKFSAFTRASSM